MRTFLILCSLLAGSLTASACASTGPLTDVRLPVERHRAALVPVGERRVFRARIDAYGRQFSGLMYLRRLHPDNFRIVCMSETGFGFFDIGFRGTEFTEYHCLDFLQEKGFLEAVRQDMGLLLLVGADTGEIRARRAADGTMRFTGEGERGIVTYTVTGDDIGQIDSGGFFGASSIAIEFGADGRIAQITIDRGIAVTMKFYPLEDLTDEKNL